MIRYVAVEEQLYTSELGWYRTYGIRAENECGETVTQISDVSPESGFAEALAKACTEGELSPEQLQDVILNSI